MKITLWTEDDLAKLNGRAKDGKLRFGKNIGSAVYVMKGTPKKDDAQSIYRAGAIGLNRKPAGNTGEADMTTKGTGNDAAQRFDQYQAENKKRPSALPWRNQPWRYIFGLTLEEVNLAQIATTESLLHYRFTTYFTSLGSSCYVADNDETVILIGSGVKELLEELGPKLFAKPALPTS